jgi:hypothetical protein
VRTLDGQDFAIVPELDAEVPFQVFGFIISVFAVFVLHNIEINFPETFRCCCVEMFDII